MVNYLNQQAIADFAANGFVKIPGFYDREREIEPIQRAVYEIIGAVIRRHGLPITREPFSPDHFDAGFMDLVAIDRRLGSEVYDALKLIPAFVRLAASEKNEGILRQLRQTTLPGFIARGYGIRIDIPGEHAYRALWHQEYLFQLRSRDGLTLWSPLVGVTAEMGPVVFACGSHTEGIHRVHASETNKPGTYAWIIENESQVLGKYQHAAPISHPGDLIILDFQVLHCSGFNHSTRPRWTMQMRLFNFLETSALETGWSGAVAEGVRVQDVVPQYFIAAPAAA